MHFGYVAEKHTQNMQALELSTMYRDLDNCKLIKSKPDFDRTLSEYAKPLDSICKRYKITTYKKQAATVPKNVWHQ